jgi:RNA polymerase sigma-70 factor (ECF subfamily)
VEHTGSKPEVSRVAQSRDAAPPIGADAFRAIFSAEFSYVCHSLRRLGVRPADIEDIAHDVFVAVVRHLHEYDRARPVRPWLFGIAFRIARDYRRLARHEREVVGADSDAADDAPKPDDHLAAKQTRELVAEALAALDIDRKAVFLMHDLDGHSAREIAAALGIPANTVFSRLRVARAEFKTAVDRIRRRKNLRGGA